MSTRFRFRRLCRKAFGGLILLTLFAAPTQWSMALPGGFHLTLADILLAAAVPVALFAGIRPRRFPATHAIFLGLTFLTIFFAVDRLQAVKEWLQFFLYFGVGTLLAEAALRRHGLRGLRMAVGVFLASGTLNILLALAQYWLGAPDDPLVVRGAFGNRNVLGGYLALLLPLAYGLLLHAPARAVGRQALLGLLVAGGLLVCLSGPAMLAVSLVLVVMAGRGGTSWLIETVLVLMLGFTLLLPLMPRHNDYEAFASMSLYDEAGQPTRRYPEWQAATVMTLERPWTGWGLGSYQRQIGPFYGVVPNATGPAEPDIQNLYLVLAASAGIPACLAFLAMLSNAAIGAAWAGHRAVPGRSVLAAAPAGLAAIRARAVFPGLGAGIAGALLAFALTAVWHPLLVRGIGLPLAFLLAAARSRQMTGNG